ncbi:MAG: sigma factor-like helix-turn-helix DNA-binding protein [Actinomycetota bacterium]
MRDADTSEFDDLFRREYPGLVGTIRMVLGESATADDVVQDAFVQLLVHWRKVSGYQMPGAWVRRVALRMALRRRTRRSAEVRAMRRAGGVCAEAVVDPDLHAALRALPAMQRAAIVLHYLEDCPIAEVADLLGCAEGTVKSHLFRGRQRLNALLGESEETDVAR